MPINRERESLFIHIPRTGGTRVEQLLNMTFNGDAPATKYLMLFGYAPLGGKKYELQHLTYKEIIKHKLISRKEFNSFFKFSFVRNPYDRLVSTYFYIGHKYFNSFKDFVRFIYEGGGEPDRFPSRWAKLNGFKWFLEHPLARPQFDFIYNRNNRLIVDFLGKFENYVHDLSFILEELGESPPKSLLNQKVNATDHKAYKSYYNKKTKDMARSIYFKDFEAFDYV
jgi:hypothetical protein